jgi:hypothetical protein
MSLTDLRDLVEQAGVNDAWYEDPYLPGRPVLLRAARPVRYRLLDLERRIPARDRFARDSPLEGRVHCELVSGALPRRRSGSRQPQGEGGYEK